METDYLYYIICASYPAFVVVVVVVVVVVFFFKCLCVCVCRTENAYEECCFTVCGM